MYYSIPKKAISQPKELVKPIFPHARPENDELDPLEYIDCTCHNIPGDSMSREYVIKILRFGTGTPEEWIIFMELVQKILEGKMSPWAHPWIMHGKSFNR